MKLFLFFLLISRTNSLLCVTNSDSIRFSIKSFNSTDFEDAIHEKLSASKNAQVCRVTLTINTLTDIFEVKFTHVSLEGKTVSINHSKLVTTFTLSTTNSSTHIELIYVCDAKDNCDVDFTFSRYLFMINQNYNDLQRKLTRLIGKQNKPSNFECVKQAPQSEIISCTIGACKTTLEIYQFSTKKKFGGCESKKVEQPFVSIKTSANFTNNTLTHAVAYTCMTTRCNTESTTNTIIHLIQTLYDASSILYGLEKNISTNEIITTTSSSLETEHLVENIQSSLSTTEHLVENIQSSLSTTEHLLENIQSSLATIESIDTTDTSRTVSSILSSHVESTAFMNTNTATVRYCKLSILSKFLFLFAFLLS